MSNKEIEMLIAHANKMGLEGIRILDCDMSKLTITIHTEFGPKELKLDENESGLFLFTGLT
jgi:hypothetical protein